MSIFRNLDRVISSQLLSKPNSFLLPARFRAVYLETSTEPNLDHLQALKPLFLTIQALEPHVYNDSYTEIVQNELEFLNEQKRVYRDLVARFVSQAGYLNASAIGNIYFAATQEEDWLRGECLEANLHHEVPTKYKLMSRGNLVDTLAGLHKFHPGSSYIPRLEEELQSRPSEEPVYVEHQNHESLKYEYSEEVTPRSNNPLVDALNRSLPTWQYQILAAISRTASLNRYPLHHP